MPLIRFPGKELQTSTSHCWIPVVLCTPRRSLKTPRKIAQKDTELENLLRDAFRLRKAQKRAVPARTEASKRNRKAR